MLESPSTLRDGVTFCSVSYYSEEYLKLNKELTKVENWVVVNNDERFIPGFTNIPGVPQNLAKQLTPEGFVGYGSYHHALGLNKLVKDHTFNTRYVCFIDPDFFIFEDIQQILQKMQDNQYWFYGAPYYPTSRERIYQFPVAFCMFVDRKYVDVRQFNFLPVGEDELGTKFVADTGYRIYKDFAGKCNHWSAIPSFVGKTQVKHTQKNLLNLGIRSTVDFDEYYLDNGLLFGLHCHMKLHLRVGNMMKLQERTVEHLFEIKRIYKKVKGR
jgi:hypothetical protein